MKIIDLLAKSSEKYPSRTACINESTCISYEQLLGSVQLLARHLKKHGCCKGVKIAIVLNNSIEYLIGFFAVSAAGGTICPLWGNMTSHEISSYLIRADISMIITNDSLGSRLIDSREKYSPAAVLYIQYQGQGKLRIISRQYGDCQVDYANGDVALMVPTSGSTKVYKIVMLRDDNLISNMLSYRVTMNFSDPNVVYCALSMHHIYPICAQILTHISLGDTFIVHDNPFFIKEFFLAVQKYHVTICAFVPYMAILMAQVNNPGQFNWESLKYITLSGAKTPAPIYHQLEDIYKTVRFVNMYGMSEAGSRISLAASFEKTYPGDSVGEPMTGVDVKIVNDNGTEAPADTVGQVIVKSSGLMKGYYKQNDLTGKTLVDGWLHTGDLGRLDRQGNLFLVGRIKGIIISGGHNINPAEIEQYIAGHPLVAQVAVVGKQDKLLQEVPCAFVVKNNSAEELQKEDIVKMCRKGLSRHKVPHIVSFIDKLPLLNSSKINRNHLMALADNLVSGNT